MSETTASHNVPPRSNDFASSTVQNDFASSVERDPITTEPRRTRTGTPFPDLPLEDFPPISSELEDFVVSQPVSPEINDLGVFGAPSWLKSVDAVSSLDDPSCGMFF